MKKKRRRFFEKYSFKTLQTEIQSYGYNFSIKQFAQQAIIYFSFVIVAAVLSKLNVQYIVFLGIITALALPFMISSQFDQLYQMRRFQMVNSYLQNVIPIFENKPVIMYAWREVSELVDGEMKECILEAMSYVENNTEDVNVYDSAFKIIEEVFPNSRIHSVHQMMLTIANQNSKTYHDSVKNMYYDVTSWISRTYSFQKELKNRKNKLIVLCLITMAMNFLIIYVFGSHQEMAGFTDMPLYQISTFVFLAGLLLMICMIYIKLNGKWLINDKTEKTDQAFEKSWRYLISDKPKKPTVPQMIVAAIVAAGGFYVFTSTRNNAVLLLTLGTAFMLLYNNKRLYNLHKRRTTKAIEIEFPVWLRDVALNLSHLRVINAIENSKKTTSVIMNYYIDQFLKEVQEDPTSIKPYNQFLDEFDLPDVKSSMRILFTLQELNQEQLQEQTNSLIVRNQTMLAKSEAIKNEDSIGSIEALGFVPLVMFVFQMLVSMVAIWSFMMEIMYQAMNSI